MHYRHALPTNPVYTVFFVITFKEGNGATHDHPALSSHTAELPHRVRPETKGRRSFLGLVVMGDIQNLSSFGELGSWHCRRHYNSTSSEARQLLLLIVVRKMMTICGLLVLHPEQALSDRLA